MSTIANVWAILSNIPKFYRIEKLTAKGLIAPQVAWVAQALALAKRPRGARLATLCERRA
ncbi:MAG: hypothetical protein F6K26_02910 [Moorea sp. SIO2I5]|nr:hypothetical protein [Moorena sp. SIO2I5]